jgi:hypothetical protein
MLASPIAGLRCDCTPSIWNAARETNQRASLAVQKYYIRPDFSGWGLAVRPRSFALFGSPHKNVCCTLRRLRPFPFAPLHTLFT